MYDSTLATNATNIQYHSAISNLDHASAEKISNHLNHILANEFALFTKTLNFHWNVTGPRFNSLHNFMEQEYKGLLTVMDDIAERIRFMGKTPISTVKRFSKEMDLNEQNGNDLSASQMLGELFQDNIQMQTYIKEALREEKMFKNDPGTHDFLVNLLQKHEVTSWKLKSHFD